MLTLPIKKIWFDMIVSGEKKEEYREITRYWKRRLLNTCFPVVEPGTRIFQIAIQNGYSENAPKAILNVSGIDVGPGKPEWGAEPGKMYYIIHIRDVAECENMEAYNGKENKN